MGWLIFMWFVILIVMLILYFIMIAFKVSKLYHDIEKRQNDIYDILNEKSVIKADNQKYKTMLEQFNIRKAEFSSKIIQGKSEEKLQDTVIQKYQEEFEQVVAHIKSITSQISDYNDSITKLKENIAQLSALPITTTAVPQRKVTFRITC